MNPVDPVVEARRALRRAKWSMAFCVAALAFALLAVALA